VSGGGRCNVTNAIVTERDFWGGRPSVIRHILRAFAVPETIVFFEQIGITLHEEHDGKLFPDSNRARDVLDALLREAERVGVGILTDHRVDGVVSENNTFIVVTTHGPIAAKRLVLATGGRSLPKSGSDGTGYDIARVLGHTIVPTTPALAPLLLGSADARAIHRDLSGVALDVEIAVWIDRAVATRLTGALLWTHFGISGPVVLNASRHWARAGLEQREVRLTLNLIPGERFEDLDAVWMSTAAARPRSTVRSTLAADVPEAMAAAVLRALELAPDLPLASLTRDDRRRLVHALVEWPLQVVDTRGYNYAEVTAGGVALDEIDPSTMESRVCPGLFLVGEILDVDGRIGGFNFQWAWSSAAAAARALAGGKGTDVRLRDPP
jgi:predicted Rossmann fold flavoprotein